MINGAPNIDTYGLIKSHHCRGLNGVESVHINKRKYAGERWMIELSWPGLPKLYTEIHICPYYGEILDEKYVESRMPKPLKQSMDAIKALYGKDIRPVVSVNMEVLIDPTCNLKASDFTCYGCAGATEHFKEGGGRCDFAFDPCNTQGDCLMDK
jgi:hypothetical protein